MPPALRILLLALAVIDDVGAILVIAIFYSSGLAPMGFLVLGMGLVSILAMQILGVRSAVGLRASGRGGVGRCPRRGNPPNPGGCGRWV